MEWCLCINIKSETFRSRLMKFMSQFRAYSNRKLQKCSKASLGPSSAKLWVEEYQIFT